MQYLLTDPESIKDGIIASGSNIFPENDKAQTNINQMLFTIRCSSFQSCSVNGIGSNFTSHKNSSEKYHTAKYPLSIKYKDFLH